jgi:hypothetical protein
MGGRPKPKRGLRLKSTKRLLIRESDIILSGSVVGASAQTRCVPKAPLIADGNVIFLRSSDRELIEQWLETGEISLLRVEQPEGVEKATGEAASNILELTNRITNVKTALRFYRHNPKSRNTHYQVDFKREVFQPDWRAGVNLAWFANLRQVWADPWFADLGRYKQIIRPHNATLALRVTAKHLEIIFNRQGGVHQPPSERFPFPNPVDPPLKKPQETTYFSKDLAPILLNIADADIDGVITIAGNQHALVFQYQTPMGEFEISVPTLDDSETQRDETLFYRWR